jgi:hypothetical protein
MRIGGKATRKICELQASSAEDAIKRAIKEYGITDPLRQSRIAAYRAT